MSNSQDEPSFKEILDEMGAAAKRLADALIDMMKTLMEHQEKQRSEQLKTLMKMLKSAGYEQSPENAQKLQAHLDEIAKNKTELAKVEKQTEELAGKKSLTPDEVQKVKDLENQRSDLLKEQEQLLSPEGGPELSIDEVALQLKNRNAQAKQATEQVAAPEAPAVAPDALAAAPDAPDVAAAPPDIEQENELEGADVEANTLKADGPEQGPAAEVAANAKWQPAKAAAGAPGAPAKAVSAKIGGAKAPGVEPAANGPLKVGLENILERDNKPGSVGARLADEARKALKGGFKQVAKIAHKAVNAIK